MNDQSHPPEIDSEPAPGLWLPFDVCSGSATGRAVHRTVSALFSVVVASGTTSEIFQTPIGNING